MGDQPDRAQSTWDRIRGHVLARAAVVYGSAVFFLLQLLDLLGVPNSVIRGLAITAAFAFVVAEGFYLWKSMRPAGGALAPERLRRWVLSGRRWLSAAIVLLILGTGTWLIGRRLIRSPVRAGTDVIAVMPFVATGDGVQDLGHGMVSLLSANLDQVGGIRVIDPGTVLHGWNRRASSGRLDLEGALQVGREIGAGAILWGSIATVGKAVQLTGEIYTVDGERVAQRQERGGVDQLHALIDRLSVQLLREIWRGNTPVPDLRIAAITTGSPQALHAFLRGERYFRAARYDSAVALFEEAVQADSTFALAHFRLSEAYGWSTHMGAPRAVQAAEAAHRFAMRLPDRERALATAQLLHEKGDFAALDSIRAITLRHPDDPLAWYMLGDILVHSRVMLEPPMDSLIVPFRRAVALDPTPSGGMIHMLEEALNSGDRALFDEFLAHYRAAAGPERAARWEQLAHVRWAPTDSLLARAAEVASHFVQQRAPGMYTVRAISAANTRFATEMELVPENLVAMMDQTATTELGQELAVFRIFTIASLGRIREASALLDTIAGSPAGTGLPPPPFIRVIWSAIGLYPADSLPAQFALLEHDSTWAGDEPIVRRFLLLGLGDLQAAQNASLPPLPADTGNAPNTDRAHRMALDALALQLQGDTTEAITLMRAAIREAGYSFDATRRFNSGPLFMHAVALASQPATRAEGMRRLRSQLMMGNPLVVRAYFAVAETLEAEGDRTGAAQAYTHILRLWKNADPHLQQQVQRAREALSRLTAERQTSQTNR